MDLVERFERAKKKLTDAPKKKRQEKLARGADIHKFVTSFHPSEVDREKYRDNYDKIFAKKGDDGSSVSEESQG